MSSNNGRLAIPGQVNTEMVFHVQPHVITMQNGSDFKVHFYGGYTKFEQCAAQIMAALMTARASDGYQLDDLAKSAADAASAILQECHARQNG